MSIEEKLNIDIVDDVPEKTKEIVVKEEENPLAELMDDSEEDYETTRQTFKDLVSTASTAVEKLAELAEASEHPRVYEVLGQLIRTANESTKNLYELHQKRIAILEKKYRGSADQNINVDKAIFVGTPSELFDKIKDMRKEEIKELTNDLDGSI